MKKLAMLFIALLTVAAQGAVLDTIPGTTELEGVMISKGGTAKVENPIALTTVGAGIRKKKVAVIRLNVYVAELLVSDGAKYVRTNEGALSSLDNMQAVAFQMTFLRTVDAEKVQSSFRDGLDENDEALARRADVAQFLEAVKNGGEAVEKGTLRIVAERQGEKEIVVYENTKGEAVKIVGAGGFIRALMSIWLGAPADGGLEDLKENLIKGSN
ncbi:MAG: chalcone isomerase family protein [Bdellovibrionales bacterium]|nr:chalcone isomerase family protein [Bdellovibrionales bacterium]